MLLHILAVFTPLLSALVVGLAGRTLGDRLSHAVSCGGMAVAALASIMLFGGHVSAVEAGVTPSVNVVQLLDWVQSGAIKASWSLRFDALSLVMVLVVNVVSLLVHVYSVGYMSHDDDQPRFMAYLSLFTFMMLMLVTANDFLQMFFGWEGVGLASYLLIGFWYERASANRASIKAFIVNRVGDFGFILGIFSVFLVFGSVEFDTVFAAAPVVAGATMPLLGLPVDALTAICLLLFMGAMGKSAQLGLHTWLPDAMEGPTPVSALIHAATMVTAGVFMLCRCSPLLEQAPHALAIVALIGAATALVAATIGMTQFDIKRVIAYSTMSQLGYMFFAIGVGAYGAAMFHLMTHAFFKALLFLGAGSVIHAMSDEQDMRRMGGIWRYIPVTYVLMWIGSLALAGLPWFAGYYSKDMILEAAYADRSVVGYLAFWIGVLAALLTAFYSWRLIYLTFHGRPRADEHVMAHIHESSPIMLGPLFVLAAGALLAGAWAEPWFVGDKRLAFWGGSLMQSDHDVIHAAHEVASWVAALPVLVGVIGIAAATAVYLFGWLPAAELRERYARAWRFFAAKWYFDELYARVFERPTDRAAQILWRDVDIGVIDSFGPGGASSLTSRVVHQVNRSQSGYVFNYAFAMLVGVVLAVTWFVFVAYG